MFRTIVLILALTSTTWAVEISPESRQMIKILKYMDLCQTQYLIDMRAAKSPQQEEITKMETSQAGIRKLIKQYETGEKYIESKSKKEEE